MMMLNQLTAVSVRRLATWEGAWIVDVDVDLSDTDTTPSGRCTLTIGASTLVGTIDTNASGKFATHFRARVIAGAGAWGTDVTSQAFHNDGVLMASVPILSTAALIGETVVVANDQPLDVDFVRAQGPAFQVMRGLDWYVDTNGITQVGPRPSIPVTDPDVHILDFDPLLQTATIATDTLLEPGMVLTDTRFASATIRQVEQTFSAKGSRATAWLSPAAGNTHSLGAALARNARIAVGLPTLRAYRYRVTAQTGKRLSLQAVSKSAGIPDQLPISIMYGVPGCSAQIAPGTIVMLQFLEGNPSIVRVTAFDDTTPVEVDITASTLVDVDAPSVGIGTKATRSGVATLETLAPLFVELAVFVAGESAAWTALAAALKDINSGLVTPQPPGPPPGTIETAKDAATAIAALATAVTEQLPEPTNFSTTVEAAS